MNITCDFVMNLVRDYESSQAKLTDDGLGFKFKFNVIPLKRI